MAQNGTEDYVPPEVLAIASESMFVPGKEVLKNEVDRLRASSATYQAALQELQSRNLRARDDDDEDDAMFGFTQTAQSVLGDEMKALSFVVDAGSDGGITYGVFFTVTQGTDPDTGRPIREEYAELVEMPTAGVADPSDVKAVALFQDGAKVAGDIQARSLLGRFTKCLRSGCSSACLGATTACLGAFPVYLKCVIVKCGGCAVKCGACAACNCRFWCKWATGCCKD